MNIDGLKKVVEKSNAVFEKMKGKYGDLSGYLKSSIPICYLVFSSPNGQCNLTADIIEIFNEFPAMITDSRQKEKAVKIAREISALEIGKKKGGGIKGNTAQTIKKVKSELSQITDKLELKDDTFVEIRFNQANLDLIFELQKDKLVSREHTLQSKASIRIVLGTIAELYQQAQHNSDII